MTMICESTLHDSIVELSLLDIISRAILDNFIEDQVRLIYQLEMENRNQLQKINYNEKRDSHDFVGLTITQCYFQGIIKNQSLQQHDNLFKCIDIEVDSNEISYYEIEDDSNQSWNKKFDAYFKSGGVVKNCFGHRLISKRTVNEFSNIEKKHLYEVMKSRDLTNDPDSLLYCTNDYKYQLSTSFSWSSFNFLQQQPKLTNEDLISETKSLLEKYNSYEQGFGKSVSCQFQNKLFNEQNQPTLMKNIAFINSTLRSSDALRIDKLHIAKVLQCLLTKLYSEGPTHNPTIQQIIKEINNLLLRTELTSRVMILMIMYL